MLEQNIAEVTNNNIQIQLILFLWYNLTNQSYAIIVM